MSHAPMAQVAAPIVELQRARRRRALRAKAVASNGSGTSC